MKKSRQTVPFSRLLGHNPNGSRKLTGFEPAYAYRLPPPASPMGSCVRKIPCQGRELPLCCYPIFRSNAGNGELPRRSLIGRRLREHGADTRMAH